MWKCFDNLKEARAEHELIGGFLMDLGDGSYGVTDDPATAYEMREDVGGVDYWAALDPKYDETLAE